MQPGGTIVNRDDVSRGNARDAVYRVCAPFAISHARYCATTAWFGCRVTEGCARTGGDVGRADHASGGNSVVQRTDAHVIPCEQRPPTHGIPRDERKVPNQVGGCIDVPLRDRFERQPRIRRREVAVQRCEQLIAIVETAIEGDDETAMQCRRQWHHLRRR